MKKILLLAITATFMFGCKNHEKSVEDLRKQHQEFLDNSPFNNTKNLSREDRKAIQLPPNAYNEHVWELEIDPNTGQTHPERVALVQEELRLQRTELQEQRNVAGQVNNPWVERGPNNIGGRTRAIMFDPNDINNANPADDYTRVFAGGVAGGIWVNDDITDPNSSWTIIPNVPASISPCVITYDPNDTNTFYIGSGESYTTGSAVGNGIWKSTDGGETWEHIFGGYTGISNNNQNVDGIFYVNDIVARNNNGSTELYAAIAGAFYSPANNPNNWNGLSEMGLYKSTDNGDTWTRFDITFNDGNYKNPSDIELDIDNNIWFSTTNNFLGGNNGGDIYRSIDGVNFVLVGNVSEGQARRTEIEPSRTNANKLWAVSNVGGQANIYEGTFDLNTNTTFFSPLTEPNDADNNISPADYTRGQAFYDLPIEETANGDLYVGGIDLFRSTDGATSWIQISKWSNNNNLAALSIPLVHADHHAIVFRPGAGNENKVVFGTDGGIYYSDDITQADTNNSNTNASINSITSRNKDYNVTQFYSGAMGPDVDNDIIVGGTQDNGTLITQNSSEGINNFQNYYAFFSGDGSNSEFDQIGGLPGRGEYHIVGSTRLRYLLADLPASQNGSGYVIVNSFNEGDFINEADLDDVGNILYADGRSGNTNRIARFTLGIDNATRDNLTNALLNSDPTAFKVSPYTNTTLLVGLRNSRLLKIENANSANPSWSNITGVSFLGSISDIEFGESDQEIFVTVHNYGVTSIWFSNDGGSSWSSIEGDLPDIPVKCILQNPLAPTQLIIGTDLGVWATPDYTATSPNWVQSYNGMSDVTVLDLDLRTADNMVLAATHGRGMFTGQFTPDALSLVKNDLDENAIQLYPTLVDDNLFIKSSKLNGQTKLDIYSITGKVVFTSNFSLSSLPKKFNLQIQSGIYFAHLSTNGKKQVVKFMKK